MATIEERLTALEEFIQQQETAVETLRERVAKLDDLGVKVGAAVAREFQAISNRQLAVLVHKGEKELAQR